MGISFESSQTGHSIMKKNKLACHRSSPRLEYILHVLLGVGLDVRRHVAGFVLCDGKLDL